MSETLAFYLFSALTLTGAINVVFRKNPIHAALFLVCSFLGIAGLFLTLGAALLAAVQVMVYAGAIMVLFLFVILLLNLAWSAVLYVRFLRGRDSFAALERWQTAYLPVYAVWAAIVVVVFPPLFGYV